MHRAYFFDHMFDHLRRFLAHFRLLFDSFKPRWKYFLPWEHIGIVVICIHWALSCRIEGPINDAGFLCFALYRYCVAHSNTAIQHNRNRHTDHLQKAENRSCGSFRSAHHYDQRPCCGRHVLWIGLDTVDQCYGIIIFEKAEVLYASAFCFLAYHILIC